MRLYGASRTSDLVPDFFVRHPTERPTRTLALSLGQGIKQSPKSAPFCFWRIVDHMSPVDAGQMLQVVDGKEFRHNKVSATIPTNFQSRQFTIAHFTVHVSATTMGTGTVIVLPRRTRVDERDFQRLHALDVTTGAELLGLNRFRHRFRNWRQQFQWPRNLRSGAIQRSVPPCSC